MTFLLQQHLHHYEPLPLDPSPTPSHFSSPLMNPASEMPTIRVSQVYLTNFPIVLGHGIGLIGRDLEVSSSLPHCQLFSSKVSIEYSLLNAAFAVAAQGDWLPTSANASIALVYALVGRKAWNRLRIRGGLAGARDTWSSTRHILQRSYNLNQRLLWILYGILTLRLCWSFNAWPGFGDTNTLGIAPL